MTALATLTRPRPHDQLGERLERMIRIQMERFPPSWSEAERREMAVKELFGDDQC